MRDIKIIKDEIRVKNREPVKFDIKLSHRGPIVN